MSMSRHLSTAPLQVQNICSVGWMPSVRKKNNVMAIPRCYLYSNVSGQNVYLGKKMGRGGGGGGEGRWEGGGGGKGIYISTGTFCPAGPSPPLLM